jgi:hypothetical protein
MAFLCLYEIASFIVRYHIVYTHHKLLLIYTPFLIYRGSDIKPIFTLTPASSTRHVCSPP